ncbi:GlcG/HbpS family heme-binding protein [Paenibacillus silvisoli]|uniref:GlcG/HbpS family heme-binding protein n=1 Tax=Paenibacillus silvisoli TaxID=3110539 RepID=UPI002805C656|nr:heme-binding protein [Paenibacillus silvisoli]
MVRMTLELALHLAAVGEQRAYQVGLPFNLAVVDECGDLVAFHRMDNALLAGIDIASNKAWTSVTMQMPTAELAKLAQPGGDAYGVNTTQQGRVVILGGGIPLAGGSQIIGGIGVSGGTSAQDLLVAHAMVQTYNGIASRAISAAHLAQAHSAYYRKHELDKMTLALAKLLLAASVRKSIQLGLRCDIAIVDDGGNLVAFYRMDHARSGDIEVSENKAWSSVALQRPTADIAQMALPGGDAYGINTTNKGRLVVLGGGIPLRSRHRVIGGIGVSGGTSAQDVEVAEAAVHAFHAFNQ